MSSFKRKTTSGSKPTASLTVYPGTRISPASNSSLITSTGVSSLDDILGGGLPLSCSLVFATPDTHSSYGDLVQRYFISQGLANGHRVCVVGQSPEAFVKDAMWFPRSQSVGLEPKKAQDSDEDEEGSNENGQKVKIAWRYEKMKQFKTTVGYTDLDSEAYCAPFELANCVPEEVIAEATQGGRLDYLDIAIRDLSTADVLGELSQRLSMTLAEGVAPLRICIPDFGSPVWGDLGAQRMLHFLHSLRGLLRKHPHGCASISLAPEISSASWGGAGWLDKLGWAADGMISMTGFSGNPSLSSIFPGHHGLVQIHRLPAPHTFSPPSDRFSTLRGLSASGENNLAFKCTRKRLVFETLHLDVEGGTGERRTTPSAGKTEHTAKTEGVKKTRVVKFDVNDF